MKSVRTVSGVFAGVTCMALAAVAGAQTSITLWDFNQPGLSTTSPAPASGVGTATLLGGVAPASTGAFASQSGSSDTNAGSAWNTSNYPAQNTASGTGGVEFQANCTGFTGVTFEYDFRCSNSFSDFVDILYSTNGGSTWTSFLTSPFQIPSANFVTNFGSGAFPGDPILTLPAAADNNPDVRVRIVTVFSPVNPGQYDGNTTGTNYGTTGTIRFDMVEFKGATSASLDPDITGSPINPRGVCAGDTTTQLLLQVNVAPGQNPTSSTLNVTADLTSVGGANNTSLIDLGGGAYGVNFTMGGAVTPGTKTIPVTVVDDQNRTDSVNLTVGVGNCSNNANSDVVIAQVYGGGGATLASPPSKQDYVVLYNRSCDPVDISNWSIQYGSAAGGSGLTLKLDLIPVTTNFIIPAKSYFLVQTNVAGVADLGPDLSTLKTPDFAASGNPGSGLNMSNTSGRVALVKDGVLIGNDLASVTLADFVGYGSSAATFDGAAPTTTLDSSNALFRKSSGNQDSNENFNDFEIFVPAPLNSTDAAGGTCTPTCPADLDNGSGSGTADGGVDINDLLYFLTQFELGNADLDNDGVDPQQPDGGTDINDLLFFLFHFEAGC